MILLSYLILPSLYRLGGSINKAFRRYGVPAWMVILNHSVEGLIGAAIACAVFHFNLDEIEERDWDDVFTYGMAIAWCFYPMAGIWSGIIGAYWLAGVWLSNNGPRIDWKYVEISMGVAMASAIHLGSL